MNPGPANNGTNRRSSDGMEALRRPVHRGGPAVPLRAASPPTGGAREQGGSRGGKPRSAARTPEPQTTG